MSTLLPHARLISRLRVAAPPARLSNSLAATNRPTNPAADEQQSVRRAGASIYPARERAGGLFPRVAMSLVLLSLRLPCAAQQPSTSTLFLGGLGAGGFELSPSMRIVGANLGGGSQGSASLPACFAAVRAQAGTRSISRVLATGNAFHLPVVSSVDVTEQAPVADVQFIDAGLSASIGLTAFSPLVPDDIKDSAIPAAAFIFHLSNPLAIPVEVSVALSWDGAGALAPAGSRVAVTGRVMPSAGGMFGVLFQRAGLPHMPGGELAVLTAPQSPGATVTQGLWSAGPVEPSWWRSFSETGDLPPASQRARGTDAVVCVRLSLKPGDKIDLPFAVGWRLSPAADALGAEGRFYNSQFSSGAGAAERLLNDSISLLALTREWQDRLLFSNLPSWLDRQIMDATQALTRGATLDALRRLHFIGPHRAAVEQIAARVARFSVLGSLFPALARDQLASWLSSGARLQLAGEAGEARFIATVLCLALWVERTGDISLAAMWQTQMEAGIRGNFGRIGSGPAGLDTLRLAAVQGCGWMLARIGAVAAGRGIDRLAIMAASTVEKQDWNGGYYGRGTAIQWNQLAGVWAEKMLGLPVLLDRDHVQRALGQVENAPVAYGFGDADLIGGPLLDIWMGSPSAGAARLQVLAQIEAARALPAWWLATDALTRLNVNAGAGSLTINPNIPGLWRSLDCPVWPPTFWAEAQFRPTVHGGTLNLRVERVFGVLTADAGKPGAADVTLRSILVPGPPPGAHQPASTSSAHVSVRERPIGARSIPEPDGSIRLVFDTPLTLTAGDELQVEVH